MWDPKLPTKLFVSFSLHIEKNKFPIHYLIWNQLEQGFKKPIVYLMNRFQSTKRVIAINKIIFTS